MKAGLNHIRCTEVRFHIKQGNWIECLREYWSTENDDPSQVSGKGLGCGAIGEGRPWPMSGVFYTAHCSILRVIIKELNFFPHLRL